MSVSGALVVATDGTFWYGRGTSEEDLAVSGSLTTGIEGIYDPVPITHTWYAGPYFAFGGGLVESLSVTPAVAGQTLTLTDMPDIPAGPVTDVVTWTYGGAALNQPATLAAIAGIWQGIGPDNVYGSLFGVPNASAPLSISSSGVLYEQDPASGCVINGQFTVSGAVYEVTFTYDNCLAGTIATYLNGTVVSALGYLDTTASPVVLRMGSSAGFFNISPVSLYAGVWVNPQTQFPQTEVAPPWGASSSLIVANDGTFIYQASDGDNPAVISGSLITGVETQITLAPHTWYVLESPPPYRSSGSIYAAGPGYATAPSTDVPFIVTGVPEQSITLADVNATSTWTYSAAFSQPATLAAIAGTWSGIGPDNTGTQGGMAAVPMTISSDGTLYEQDPESGCVINGQFTVAGAAYAVTFTYANCQTADTTPLNGASVTGVGYLDTTVTPAVLNVQGSFGYFAVSNE